MPPSPLIGGPRSTISEVIQRYETLIQHYAKISTTSSIPMPSLIYAETSIKMARFLLTIYANDGWSDKVLNLLIQGKLTDDTSADALIGPQRFMTIEDTVKHKESGIPRHEISQWVTKAWTARLDDLSLVDQVQ